jgi:hypothetical protein
MAMRKPDDMLDVCKTISLQLELLGVNEIRNVQTAIFYEQRGTYMNYEYYAKHDKTIITETTYTNNKLHEEFALKMLKGKGEYFISHIKGKEVKDWIAYQKTTNVFIDSFLETASSLNYYWFSLGPVALGISTYHPLTDEEINLFQRFLKVFELAYQRYLDIEKAEAQAREAQIEAALERVRSRTMGMQKSDELKEVIQLVYEQFVHLKINVDHAGFVVDYTPKRNWHFWIADEQDIPSKITHPYFESVWANQFNEAKEKGADLFATNLNFEEKNKFYNELLSYVPGLPDKSKDFYLNCPGLAATTVLFDNVSLYIENFSGTPYTDEENKILMRFGKVFQQTYTRFLDLQKAEAQAREAQIEAALEKVRSHSLAMHHSSELQGVVDAVSQQLHNLVSDINGGVFITINDEVNKDLTIWGSSGPANNVQKVTIPYLDKPIFTRLRDSIKNRIDFYIEEYTHSEKTEFFEHLFKYSPWNLLPPKRKKELLSREGGYSRSLAVSHYTSIFMINHNGVKFSEADNDILKRFGKVFEQSYTRFLDLEKAEAQNKIIQAENERKSNELEEARELQLAMLPKKIPEHSHLEIKVFMQTATEVGGDYYDFSYHKDGSINIAIGDATGHGMKAGTLVTMMKSLFIANSSIMDIEDFFTSSNAAIKNSNLKRMMAAFAMLNIKDHTARFINAAMPPLYHYRKKEAKIVEIKHHNLPLGAMTIGKYKSIEISLGKDDVLIMMSDGFPELRCLSDELFGYERVYSAIEKVIEKEPEEIISHLKSEATNWSDKKEPDDDVTFVVIKVK